MKTKSFRLSGLFLKKMEKIGFIITCFFCIITIGNSFAITCPPKIDPCKCTIMAYGLHILCANFNETKILVNVLSNLHNYKVENVVLHNLMLREVLPKDLFQGLEISEIAVERSNLTFQQPAFKGLDETLLRLNIAQHAIIRSYEKFTNERYTIARLTNLTELTMKKTPLNVVKDNWLNGKIPSVQKITLEGDKITRIESKAFSDLVSLQLINIANNRIKDLKRSMFPKPAVNLTVIDLSNNEIEFLPEDFFTDMIALEEVLLPGNDLTTLPEDTWKPVWGKLRMVLLSNNKLVCDSSLSWIAREGWPKELDATCTAPTALAGKDVQEVYGTLS